MKDNKTFHWNKGSVGDISSMYDEPLYHVGETEDKRALLKRLDKSAFVGGNYAKRRGEEFRLRD